MCACVSQEELCAKQKALADKQVELDALQDQLNYVNKNIERTKLLHSDASKELSRRKDALVVVHEAIEQVDDDIQHAQKVLRGKKELLKLQREGAIKEGRTRSKC